MTKWMKKHSIVTAFDYENVNYNLMIHVVLQVIVCQSIMVFSLLQQRVCLRCVRFRYSPWCYLRCLLTYSDAERQWRQLTRETVTWRVTSTRWTPTETVITRIIVILSHECWLRRDRNGKGYSSSYRNCHATIIFIIIMNCSSISSAARTTILLLATWERACQTFYDSRGH